MDVIFNLTVNKFARLSQEEQLDIKKRGRPLPDLEIVVAGSSRGKTYTRQFHKEIYFRNNWICGCNRKNALFCFPCVLFGGDKAWAEKGVRDLVHLSEKIRKHENSRNHVYNQMELGLLGSADIPSQLSSEYWINIQKHNDEVTKNRYILSKIIDCIKFCGAFELALRDHDDPENPQIGFFRGLVNFSSELDTTLEERLQKSNILKDTAKKTLDDLLDCILEVCHEEIETEIRKSQFLAVIAEETSDLSAKCQLVTIFRYIKDGEIIERFWTFLNPVKHDANDLSTLILDVIEPLVKDDKNKLIAQSYNGPGIMSEQNKGVQCKIKEVYPNAYQVHCYADQLNLIMENAASANSEVRVFFGSLHTMSTFFTCSSQRVSMLDQIVGRKLPASSRWDSNVRIVNIIYENIYSLIECMGELELDYNQTTCSQASIIRRMLKDNMFVFWLTYFHRIIPHMDKLYYQLQTRNIDSTLVKNALDAFEINVVSIRNKVDEIVEEASDVCPPSTGKRRRNSCKLDLRVAAIEICDVIVNSVRDRFSFKDHFAAVTLFASDSFKNYCVQFPVDIFNSTCFAYPMLYKDRLKTELSVIYSRLDCRELSGVLPFYKFLLKNNLEESMRETKKFLEILLTTPMMTTEADRCFSTLKRVETFLRNSVNQERLTALAMLSIEKQFITKIYNFNEKVIDRFSVKKDRRLNLIFEI